jgi:hypothetical protein
VSERPVPKPVWYKNTYFWIAGILLVVALVGIIAGQETIRDPGQKREGGLALFYFTASVLMLVNGLLSHWQTVQHYRETTGESE